MCFYSNVYIYLQGYFDLQPHLDDHTIIKIGNKVHTVGSLIGAGLESSFKKQWKDKKNNSQAGSSTNLTPFIPRPPVPIQPLPNPSTDRHHSLVDINPDPNLYQSTMNPGGCYRPVRETDDEESGDE